MGETGSASQLFLGVDGGGTGCRARVEDAEGTVLGRGIAGPAATRFGFDQSWNAIETAFLAAVREAGLDGIAQSRIHAGVGVAGYNRSGAADALAAFPHPFASISFATDGITACIGAHGGKDGGIVIVGTGSCGIGRIEGRELKVGGYGFPISDEGSGADLGLRAMRESMRAYDGRLQSTLLTKELLARFDNDPIQVIAWMDQATATEYATLAPVVFRHADQGDFVARRVVQNSVEHINDMVRALTDAGTPAVSLIGGLSSILMPWLAPDVRRRLVDPIGDALAGAIALAKLTARRHAGIE
jgi:glucosamine kinase